MKTTKIQRWWDVPASIFLLGALFSAAIRLQSTRWTENLERTGIIVVLGVIFGLALGKSIFRGRTTFLMGLVYSLFIIPWQLVLLMPDMDVNEQVNLLYARVYWSTADFLANKPVRDPILFLTTMMILYWFASLLASYRLVRNANPWLPLLSLGGMILVIEYTMEMYRFNTQSSGSFYSFLYLLFCLLLMGRIYYLRSKKDWEQRGGTVEMEVGYDLGRGVAFAAVILALLAWNTPRIINFFDSENPANERISEGWQSLKDRISKAANSLRSPNALVVEGYGSSMSLGNGGQLGDNLIFTVKPEVGRLAGRMYWTGRTYDKYLGSGKWDSSHVDSLDLGPSTKPVTLPSWDMRKEAQFTFRPQIPLLRTLYFTSEPLNVNRVAKAVASTASDGATDVNAIVVEPPIQSGEEYVLRATVAQPSVTAMRESGEEYPEYITDRYLQLPANFSPRIAELANQIAGAEATPYDKAQAITQYLRRTITYSETVPEIPAGRDPIEWFLFDLRAGFCNYYATSEVLMLRSLGVPARMVAGYAEGEWDEEAETFKVIGKDSHAWPEVYFPDLGWVVFEPTVSQPLATFPLGERPDDLGPNSPSGGVSLMEPTPDPMRLRGEQLAEELDRMELEEASALANRVSPWTIVLGVVLAIGAVLAFLEFRRRRTQDLPFPSWMEKTLDERGVRTPDWLRLWSRRSLRTPMENLFANVAFMLRVWGQKIDPTLTPAEQVAALINILPAVKEEALMLLEEYQRAMYSQYPADLGRAKEAVSEIRSVGYRNRVMKLVGFQN